MSPAHETASNNLAAPATTTPPQPEGRARKQVTIYTDGACHGNPGPGGYAAILSAMGVEKEIVGGFRLTTNNRMELYAAIAGLRALKEPCVVTLHTDSQYVMNSIEKGWARRWRANGWMRGPGQPAINPDLWEQLLQLCDKHQVKFVWVRGHAGNSMNERCDRLANAAARQPGLPPDEAYERLPRARGATTRPGRDRR